MSREPQNFSSLVQKLIPLFALNKRLHRSPGFSFWACPPPRSCRGSGPSVVRYSLRLPGAVYKALIRLWSDCWTPSGPAHFRPLTLAPSGRLPIWSFFLSAGARLRILHLQNLVARNSVLHKGIQSHFRRESFEHRVPFRPDR